jgi:hypothetical protein
MQQDRERHGYTRMKNRILRRTFLLCAPWLMACADLDHLPSDTCGNGVLEPATEDCDSTVPSSLRSPATCGAPSHPLACRLICEDHDECPSGWRCAEDGACVHAGSDLVEAHSVATWLDEWSLGDLDGDRIVDLVGMRGGELETRYGDGTGRFGEPRGRFVDRVSSISIRDANGDGMLEIAVPTPSGVVVLVGDLAREIGPRPLAYAPGTFELNAGLENGWGIPVTLPPVHVPSSAPCDGAVTLVSLSTGGLYGRTISLPHTGDGPALWGADESVCPAGAEPACMGTSALRLPRLPGTPDDDGNTIVIAPPNRSYAIVVTPEWNPLAGDHGGLAGAKGKLFLPSSFEVSSEGASVLADADADAELDIHVSACSDELGRRVLRAPRHADGSIGPFEIDPRFDLGGNCDADSSAGVLLAGGDLNQDGLADYVLSTGVHMSDASSGALVVDGDVPLAPSWREAVIADFDGNGLQDIAAIRRDAARIDVLYATTCQTTCSWAVGSIDLTGEPRLLTAAQLDGLPGTDLAFAVRGGDQRDRVEVAFGGSGGLGLPRNMAAISRLQRMEAGRFRNPMGHCDATMDLALSRKSDATVGFVILEGSARRAMYAPLVLGIEGKVDRPLAVLLARGGDQEPPWLMALGARDAEASFLYAAPDVLEEGSIRTTPKPFLSAVCSHGPLESAFVWTPADVDGDGAEEAIGVEGGCDSSDPARDTARLVIVKASGSFEERTLPGALAKLGDLLVHDLDGDTFPDLVLAGHYGVRIWWGGTDVWSGDPTELSLLGARSLAVLDADAQPGQELAVLAGDRIHILTFAGRSEIELSSTTVSATAERIRVADVDGDGVDDLVVSDPERLQVLLGVPHRSIGR